MKVTQKRISKHVLWAEINRPKALNAIDFDVVLELEKLVSQIEKDEEIRLFILSGAGNQAFVSGGDLKKFHTIKEQEPAMAKARRIHRLLNRIEHLPCWTLACVNADAYGGGIELMLSFDFRVSVPSANFGFTQGRFYLVPGWGGLTRLVEKVGKTNALKWLGKASVISAKEAFENQVIEDVLEGENLQKETLTWAEPLLRNDRTYITTLKEGAARFSKQKAEAIAAEIEPFSKLWADKQHLERVEKFIGKE